MNKRGMCLVRSAIRHGVLICVLFLAGCNTMADLERERSIVVEWKGQEGIGGTGVSRSRESGQEGIGGTGLDPEADGIGGTGIIGLVMTEGDLKIGGIPMASPDEIAVFLEGEPASLSQLATGQIAAVLVDAGNTVQQIHVFDSSSGPPAFLGEVEKLIVRGELGQLVDTGITIPAEVAAGVQTGQEVQLRATAVATGVFRVRSVESVNLSIPQELPMIVKPDPVAPQGQPEAQSPQPSSQGKVDVPVAPVTPSQPEIETPEVLPTPTVTTVTTIPEPVQPAPEPAPTVRVPKVEPTAPVSVQTVNTPQLPVTDSPGNAVQAVTPPTVEPPPVITPVPDNPKTVDSTAEMMQPADTTATRP